MHKKKLKRKVTMKRRGAQAGATATAALNDLRGHVAVFFHQRTPTREHDDRSGGRFALDDLGKLAAIQIGHTKVGDDNLERSTALRGESSVRTKCFWTRVNKSVCSTGPLMPWVLRG